MELVSKFVCRGSSIVSTIGKEVMHIPKMIVSPSMTYDWEWMYSIIVSSRYHVTVLKGPKVESNYMTKNDRVGSKMLS
jgi:hypothetical protein